MPVIERDPVGVVLAEVRDMGPVTVRDIAAGTGLSESTVRRALKYLEGTGYVESDNYQRRSHVWMTPDNGPTGDTMSTTKARNHARFLDGDLTYDDDTAVAVAGHLDDVATHASRGEVPDAIASAYAAIGVHEDWLAAADG